MSGGQYVRVKMSVVLGQNVCSKSQNVRPLGQYVWVKMSVKSHLMFISVFEIFGFCRRLIADLLRVLTYKYDATCSVDQIPLGSTRRNQQWTTNFVSKYIFVVFQITKQFSYI